MRSRVGKALAGERVSGSAMCRSGANGRTLVGRRSASVGSARRVAGAGVGPRLPRGSCCAAVADGAKQKEGALARPWSKRDARLVLQDGTVWHGRSFGHKGTVVAEIVFNTSLTGYQEILTDPSYDGQAVVFTQPHIGNVGINEGDMESSKVYLKGCIVRHLSERVSNYRSVSTLSDYLERMQVVGISDVDTRAITRRLRDEGSLVGVICTDESVDDESLVSQARGWSILGKDLIGRVSCTEPYEWRDPTDGEWEYSGRGGAAGGEEYHVVAYDYGIKTNILRRLASYGCRVTVVPASFPSAEVKKMNPDGVFFSNGPGDPSAAPYAVENAKDLLGFKPSFGICMGHQICAQALGLKTYKLKFGHHGGNHPIKNMTTDAIEVSAQNHNFAVGVEELPGDVKVTHVNLNDGTCAGLVSDDLKLMTIQYHPEASPGPHDADVAFKQFVDLMAKQKK